MILREMKVSYSGKRIERAAVAVRSPEEIVELVVKKPFNIEECPWERFIVFFLDGRNKVICWREIAEGTPTQAMPYVRTIIRDALLSSAAGIACVHNHPSGSTEPSRDDKVFTKALKEACDLMGITLLDHIIVGERSFRSFVEGGLI